MDIRNKARQWAQQVVELHGLEVPPCMQHRKNKLMKRANAIKKTMEAADPLAPMMPVAQELGFVPLILLGGMAAVTAMTKWVKDAYVVKKDADKYDTLVKSGLTPAQAQKVLTDSGFNWKYVAIPAGIAIGGLLLYKIMRAK